MSRPDIRWIQRFENYTRAVATLRRAVGLSEQRALSELEQQGLIHAFEFTHELAWNVLKDYLEEQGYVGIIGSRNATREAFKNQLLTDGQVWMDMIKARNQTSHTYNTALAEEIAKDILMRFFPAFAEMETRFRAQPNLRMNADRFGLPPAAVEMIRGVLAAHPHIEQAVIYGSRAMGNYQPGSDIDLTLHGDELTHDELLAIMTELDDLLLPYMIDLSLYRMIDHAGLRDHIQRVGQEFYRRQDADNPPTSQSA